MKKTARNIIILHTCSNYDNNTRYSSWDTKWDRHNFLSFWAFSALYLLSPNNLENQNFENMKKVSGMSSFCTCVRCIATGGTRRAMPHPSSIQIPNQKRSNSFRFNYQGYCFSWVFRNYMDHSFTIFTVYICYSFCTIYGSILFFLTTYGK